MRNFEQNNGFFYFKWVSDDVEIGLMRNKLKFWPKKHNFYRAKPTFLTLIGLDSIGLNKCYFCRLIVGGIAL
jgi:hypothetical protein